MADGSSTLQDLPAGNLADVLTMGAVVPAWTAATPSTSNYEFIGSDSGTGVTTLSLNFAAIAPPDYVIAVYNGECQAGQGLDWRINTINLGSSYQSQGHYQQGNPPVQGLQSSADDKLYGALSGVVAGSPAGVVITLKVYVNPLAQSGGGAAGNIFYENNMTCDGGGVRNDAALWYCAGSNTTASVASITDIEILGASFDGSLEVWAVRN